ncbi:MAG: metallophosphoesterase [Oscillospiraceae bacterium]|nr:metallophosphoesterase [Oscillospiraceae bacterium]
MKTIKNILLFLMGWAMMGIIRGRELSVVRYKIHTGKTNGKIRLVLLSDLHSNSYGRGQKKLIRAIEAVNPDLILMAGDIADHIIPHANTKILLRKLGDYPCFYVSGNHEFKSGEVREIKHFFRELGADVLEGECRKVNVRGNKINICGVDDAVIGAEKFKKQLLNCAREADSRNYTILLTHRPEKINLYEKLNFNLILTGHTHGGQIRLPHVPSAANGIYAVHQGFKPKYAGGIYNIGESFDNYMVVSRGLSKSTRGIPRIFNRPELVVIDVCGG